MFFSIYQNDRPANLWMKSHGYMLVFWVDLYLGLAWFDVPL